jgi:hypothetical protein
VSGRLRVGKIVIKASKDSEGDSPLEGTGDRARTDDFLAAIAETRPTLTAEIVSSFDEQTREFARF